MEQDHAHDPVAVPLVGTSMPRMAPEVGNRELARFGKHAPHLAAARRPFRAPVDVESFDYAPPAPGNAPALPGPGMR